MFRIGWDGMEWNRIRIEQNYSIYDRTCVNLANKNLLSFMRFSALHPLCWNLKFFSWSLLHSYYCKKLWELFSTWGVWVISHFKNIRCRLVAVSRDYSNMTHFPVTVLLDQIFLSLHTGAWIYSNDLLLLSCIIRFVVANIHRCEFSLDLQRVLKESVNANEKSSVQLILQWEQHMAY